MKKLLLVLLVVTLASFLFVGCLPTTPAEGEGEGEGEGECETTVEIDGAVVVDGKTYVSGGNHTITVTFCAPVVGGVSAFVTYCGGYYGEIGVDKSELNGGSDVVLFPNEDRTVWTGSGYFGCMLINGIDKDDKRENAFFAISAGLPVTRTSSIKFAYVGGRTQKDLGNDNDHFILGFSTRF